MIEILTSKKLPIRVEIDQNKISLFSHGYLVSEIPFDVEDEDEIRRYALHLLKSSEGSHIYKLEHPIVVDEDYKLILNKDVRLHNTTLEFVHETSEGSHIAFKVTLTDKQIEALKEAL